ncbi:MAG: alpha/beta family hydrolase [Bacillus sp. (in: firmicutes)]
MKFRNKRVKATEQEVLYTHIETGSEQVCFMFSGFGYTYDKPLFYYSTMLMIENQIDVVHVHYTYGEDDLQKPVGAIAEQMMGDIKPVLREVLKEGCYKELFFLGKSIGTIPIISRIMNKNEFQHARMILLTPLIKHEQLSKTIMESKHQGLLIIGDRDRHYNASLLEQMATSDIRVEVIRDANHSLDIETFETGRSLSMLADIMAMIEGVVCEGSMVKRGITQH